MVGGMGDNSGSVGGAQLAFLTFDEEKRFPGAPEPSDTPLITSKAYGGGGGGGGGGDGGGGGVGGDMGWTKKK